MFDNGDGLITEVTEGGIYTLRTIVGGYGAYVGASGQCHERGIGTIDTSMILSADFTLLAPNLGFEFKFV